jgi:cytochrome c-type biogenesis protein CcmH
LKRACLLLLAASLLLPVAARAQSADATLPDIEDEVMCPICGTTLGLSGSSAAERQRVFIREQIALGLDKEQIKDALVEEYGPEVLALPDTGGFDLAAWLVPGLALIAGGGALAMGIRRWRRDGPGDDEPPPPASGSAGDEERLTTDLGRYDL